MMAYPLFLSEQSVVNEEEHILHKNSLNTYKIIDSDPKYN